MSSYWLDSSASVDRASQSPLHCTAPVSTLSPLTPSHTAHMHSSHTPRLPQRISYAKTKSDAVAKTDGTYVERVKKRKQEESEH